MNNLQINFVNFVVICDKNRKELNIKKNRYVSKVFKNKLMEKHGQKVNYIHLFKNCRFFISADTCMYDQFEMMHGKFKQSITKEFYYKNSFSFHFAFNREQASFLSKTIFQSRACKIFCLLLSTMMTMNTIKEQLYSGSLSRNIMNIILSPPYA